MTRSIDQFPTSIAIAGAWGYIGRKFLDVALSRGLTPYVFDPGPPPNDLDLGRLVRIDTEAEFYTLPVDLFHLAVHPECRRLDRLLRRSEPVWILNEKPMAPPERPEQCRAIVDAVHASQAIVLYDFPELYDPMTDRVLDYLATFADVCVNEVLLERSKDREDPNIPRNYKRMVPIQYQESVHCLAFVLHLLSRLKGSVAEALAGGVNFSARARPYEPPNPDAYPYVVDGECQFEGRFGEVQIAGHTNFKRGAPWAKRRVIRGFADSLPFEIEISYLEGHKFLRINASEQRCDPFANSYEHVLATMTRWAREVGRDRLMACVFPNPAFTHMTYQLSAALWRSSRDHRAISFSSARELESWGAEFGP
jgi:predicted dehydrogenase